MHSRASVEIDRPAHFVFDVTTNRVTEWSDVVIEDEVLEETPEGVGTKFRVVTEDHGCRMEFDGVVTRYEPPRAHSIEMRGKRFDIFADYTFEDLGTRTRVTQESRVEGKGFVKFMFLLFGWFMRKSGCKALEKELTNLKKLAEST